MKRKDPVAVTFWGVRGSVAAHDRKSLKYGGHTSCVAVHYRKQWFVLDAGTGIRNLGKKLAKGREPVFLFLSHLHWDHIFGLPFFKPLYQKGRTILLGGPAHGKNSFRKTFNQIMRPPFFPIRTSLWQAKLRWQTLKQKKVVVGGVRVEPRWVAHHNGTLGFRLVFPGGKKVIYVTDQELKPSHKKFARWIEEADLLIHDSQYNRRSYAKRKGWGHSAFEIVLDTAMKAKVRKLALFHHDPDATDQKLAKRLQLCHRQIKSANSSLTCLMAQEGLRLVL